MTYEIIREIGTQNDTKVQRESFLVKTVEPVVCRGTSTFELYETDYLIVESLRILDDGVAYEETHVVASDESGTAQPAVLYLATRALTVPEAMFGIGEHNYDASIEPTENNDNDIDPDENGEPAHA